MLIGLTYAFFTAWHALIAGREQLARVLFPDVKGLLFFFGGKVLVLPQIVRSFVVLLRMFNFVGL